MRVCKRSLMSRCAALIVLLVQRSSVVLAASDEPIEHSQHATNDSDSAPHEHETRDEAAVIPDSSSDFVHPDVDITKLAFGSCHKNSRSSIPSIWDAIRNENADAWLWTGDAVYTTRKKKILVEIKHEDGTVTTTTRKASWSEKYGPSNISELESQYRQLHSNDTIGYNQFQPPHGIYGTWDDHDYGGNDMGRELAHRTERKHIFWKELLQLEPPTKLPNADGNELREGVYNSIEWGSSSSIKNKNNIVKAILLDTRWFRDEHCLPSVAHRMPLGNAFACLGRWFVAGLHLHRYIPTLLNFIGYKSFNEEKEKKPCSESTILGEQQWSWLEHQLQDTRASVIVIVSSIQVLTTNPAMEAWGHFPNEQKRLINLIARFQQTGGKDGDVVVPTIILLSGDVHHAEFLGYAHPSRTTSDPVASTVTSTTTAITSHGTRLVEITSSGLTHDCAQPKLYGRLCSPLLRTFNAHRQIGNEADISNYKNNFYVGRNYGVLSMDWMERHITVEVKDRTGLAVLSMTLPMNEIRNSEGPNVAEIAEVWEYLPKTWDGHLIPRLQKLLATIVVAFVVLKTVRSRKAA